MEINEIKDLIFYGETRNGKIKIDDEKWSLDYIYLLMLDNLNPTARENFEEIFWKRIKNLLHLYNENRLE